MMKTVLHFAVGCLVLAWVIVLYIAFALFWPVKTLEIKNFTENSPIQIKNTIVHPGESLSYQLNYCKYTDLPSTVHRTLIDGQVISLTDTAGQLPTGCHNVTVKTAVVPETINPGKYYLDVSVLYRINPFRTEIIKYHTGYFTVVAGQQPYQSSNEVILFNK